MVYQLKHIALGAPILSPASAASLREADYKDYLSCLTRKASGWVPVTSIFFACYTKSWGWQIISSLCVSSEAHPNPFPLLPSLVTLSQK